MRNAEQGAVALETKGQPITREMVINLMRQGEKRFHFGHRCPHCGRFADEDGICSCQVTG
jgi:hypothetical protein